jgi:hypothetical protein
MSYQILVCGIHNTFTRKVTVIIIRMYKKHKIVKYLSNFVIIILIFLGTADGGTVVQVLCYKSEGRCFDSRWCDWNFSLT